VNGEDPGDRLIGADGGKKIPDWLRSHFWGRLKLQVDWILSPGL